MNSSLRRRLVHKHGEPFVKDLELTVRPVKVEREVKRQPVVHTKRISKNVIRRRKV
jgi:hypothetical protein